MDTAEPMYKQQKTLLCLHSTDRPATPMNRGISITLKLGLLTISFAEVYFLFTVLFTVVLGTKGLLFGVCE